MNDDEEVELFRKIIQYFARARNGFAANGDHETAQACEDSIALAYKIENGWRLRLHESRAQKQPKI